MPDPAADPIDALLDEWQERADRGDPVSPDDLCRDRPDLLPELRRRVEVLRRFRPDPAPPPAGGAETAALDTRPGTGPDPDGTVPGYEVLEELGRGGMGVVYKARDPRLNRVVALKTVLHADRVTAARFWAEAEVMAAVRHPHVVQVFELGERAGRPFIAMEYLPGGSLADLIKAGAPMPPREAAALVGPGREGGRRGGRRPRPGGGPPGPEADQRAPGRARR